MAAGVDPSAWTHVSPLNAFQGRRELACRVGDWDLLLLRVGGDVVVLHNYCTHFGKPLTGGRVMGGQITCPFHGACFDIKTGATVSGPAVFPLRRFPSRVEGDAIWAELPQRPPSPALAISNG